MFSSVSLLLLLVFCITTNNCIEIFKLKDVKNNQPKAEAIHKLNVLIRQLPIREAELSLMRSLYWKSLCYNGWIFSSSYCNSDLKIVETETARLKEWVRTHSCTAYENAYDQWGSDSVACEKDWTTTLSTKTNIALNKTELNGHALKHTCNQAWACEYKLIKAPIRMSRSELEGDYYAGVLLENGTLRRLNSGDNFWFDNGYSYYINHTFHIHTTNEKIDCFIEKTKTICVYKGKETIYLEDLEDITCIGTTCVEPLKEGKVIYRPKPKDRRDSLSIESAYEILEEIEFEKEVLKYDVLLLSNELVRVNYILQELLYSAMEYDNYLLGRVLKTPIKTQKIDHNHFIVAKSDFKELHEHCPHYNESTDLQEDWMPFGPDCSNVTEISLYTQSGFYFDESKKLHLSQASGDFDVWRENRRGLVDLKEYMQTVGYRYRDSSMSDILSMPKGYLSAMIHGQLLMWIFVISLLLLLAGIIIKIRRILF
uniref:Envelope glycoprotein n=1 Tax=Xiangshan orthomyxo-like virus TaxID=2886237 RepID=A0A8K1P3H9_9ORTO|nr:MAG: envelope glycoprotein [Xiangshan orthomyxo-like virus]